MANSEIGDLETLPLDINIYEASSLYIIIQQFKMSLPVLMKASEEEKETFKEIQETIERLEPELVQIIAELDLDDKPKLEIFKPKSFGKEN